MLVMPLRVIAPCTWPPHMPPSLGPRTYPFPHTSPHRSSNGPPPSLRPGAAWLSSFCGGREPLLLSFRPKSSVISGIPSSVISSAVEKSQPRRHLPAYRQQPSYTQILTKSLLEGPPKKQATFQAWFCKQQSFNHLRNRSWKVARRPRPPCGQAKETALQKADSTVGAVE